MDKKIWSNEYFNEEGYAFMGAAFEVYRELGHGLSEEIYQESLEMELADRGISFTARPGVPVFYKGRRLKKRYIPDLIVCGELIGELKSVKTLLPEHEAQLLNYLRISRKPLGYLVNFGPPESVEWKRFILKEFIPEEHSSEN